LLLLAGGPGQSANYVYATDALFSPLDPFIFLGRDLISFDQRGTGESGVLRCRRLERADFADVTAAAESCAAQLGSRRLFYTTRDSVEDIEAIRAALRTPKIALAGTSYGTKVALEYALHYPQRVDRLVLDSTVALEGPDPFLLDKIAALPRVLHSLCRRPCQGITTDPVRDLETLAARLAASPLEGAVVGRNGRAEQESLNGAELLTMVTAASFPLPALPAAVRSAVLGDPAALLRLTRRLAEAPAPPARAFSAAVTVATLCEETALPWPRAAAITDRSAYAEAAAAALPEYAFLPFNRTTALEGPIVELCRNWPLAPDPPVLPSGPLPDVPVLLLAGQLDLTTPVETARRTAALFRHASVYVARDVGHSVLTSDGLFGCSEIAVERFFKDRRLPRCPSFGVSLEPRAPTDFRRLRPARGLHGRRGRMLTALRLTILDALNDGVARLIDSAGSTRPANPRSVRGGGLRGGSYRLDFIGSELRLRRAELVPGVRISGTVHRLGERRQHGRLRIQGPGRHRGALTLTGSRVRGRLSGRRVQARLPLLAVASSASARTLASAARRSRPGPLRSRGLLRRLLRSSSGSCSGCG